MIDVEWNQETDCYICKEPLAGSYWVVEKLDNRYRCVHLKCFVKQGDYTQAPAPYIFKSKKIE